MIIRKLIIPAIALFLFACNHSKPDTASTNSPDLLPPIMGWASWNNYRVNINEGIIHSQVDAMVDLGLTQYGYEYINMDDGFFGGRDKNGNIISHPERFPSGMKNLADYIHSKCLKAGIYSDAGINTCASYWDKDTIGAGMGLYGHEEQDLTTFLKDWDYDFLKVDWCGGQWLKLDEESRYTRIGQLAQQIKPGVVYNVCRWQFPGEWVTNLAHSWRISADLYASFNSILRTIDANADLWKHCSRGHYNDMDILQLGRGMTEEEDKAHFSMWCLMHSPLILGNDLTQISEQTLKIITNKELIAINQAPYVYQARRVVDNDSLEVWARPLISSMSGEIALAMLNRTTSPQTYSFNTKAIGLDAEKGYTARDLWTKEEFPASTDAVITREVPPHGVVVLHLTGTSLPFNVFQYADKKK
ncbi:MAG: glycoside hydrolase family 27 protein [Draconibacterium sp.]